MAQNGISTLSTKQARQSAKLAAAATKRATDGRRSTLNTSQLPTVYSGNDVSDNANAGGLVTGRPWT
jgi:hypothetical protein